MALTITQQSIGSGDGSAKLVVYDNLTTADTSPAAFEWVEWADRSVQVIGTFNGGTVTIEGSNDGATWAALTDPQGNAMTFTATKIEQVSEVTRYVRPRITAGTGMDIDVFFVLRRASSMRA